jgi:hypothetical protein
MSGLRAAALFLRPAYVRACSLPLAQNVLPVLALLDRAFPINAVHAVISSGFFENNRFCRPSDRHRCELGRAEAGRASPPFSFAHGRRVPSASDARSYAPVLRGRTRIHRSELAHERDRIDAGARALRAGQHEGPRRRPIALCPLPAHA